MDGSSILRKENIQPLSETEIVEIAGGTDIPPPHGIWDLIPGWLWPPLEDLNDNFPTTNTP